jgi:catechol 2,3-dioxygenase-like lactoylglutathione lyase family enzyme
MAEDPFYLCLPADAGDGAHRPVKLRRRDHPAARLALVEAAVEDELDLEASEGRRRLEHLGYRMIALEVEDMQRAAEYLKGKGFDIVWGPKVTDTYARAEIRDPNGYGIELRQWFR